METDATWTPMQCPMPDCTSELYLMWDVCKPIYVGDTFDNQDWRPDDHAAGTWKVECVAGHVVLVPTEFVGCCDKGGEGCGHDDTEYDWDEEARQFRPNDLRRLRRLVGLSADGGDEDGEDPAQQPEGDEPVPEDSERGAAEEHDGGDKQQ